MQITVKGIDSIIARVKAYQNRLEDKTHKFLEELAKIGIDTAEIKFKSAIYDGVNDVFVDKSPRWEGENTLFISAEGNAVAFIEFGTGIHYTEQHPYAAELGFQRGTYGQGKGSQETWGYYGWKGTNGVRIKDTMKGTLVLTHGNPPARAMYEAGKAMREKVVEIAKEVFAND